jgi:hypothetical protein
MSRTLHGSLGRLLMVALGAGLMLPACSTAGGAPGPGPASLEPSVTSAPDEGEIRQGIQAALDLYGQAFNDENPELLAQVVDQSNKPFRRFVKTRYDYYTSGFQGAGDGYAFTADSIEPRDFGFVQAHVTTVYGEAADWLFREVNGQWLLSEPTVDQIGAQVVAEKDKFIFHTWPWAADVNPRVMHLMQEARERVKAKLGRVPEETADVVIVPIYGLRAGESPTAAAWYSPRRSESENDHMEILAPQSYIYGFYDAAAGWEDGLRQTLVHEYTHMTHQRSFARAGKLSDWMVEGLAEWVADSFRENEVAAAVRAGYLIPIVDPSGAVYKQDLNHLALLTQDISLAYGLAASLVRYVVQEHGGLDGFWTLARAYDAANDMGEALQQSFGISYAEFDQGWRAWLKQTY